MGETNEVVLKEGGEEDAETDSIDYLKEKKEPHDEKKEENVKANDVDKKVKENEEKLDNENEEEKLEEVN